MKLGTNERPLLEGWEDMDPGDPTTWTAQVEVEPGRFMSVPVEQVAQLVAAGECYRSSGASVEMKPMVAS